MLDYTAARMLHNKVGALARLRERYTPGIGTLFRREFEVFWGYPSTKRGQKNRA